MSLSPECYQKAIGIAESSDRKAACLVYLGTKMNGSDLVGVRPAGTDGWPLHEENGLIHGYGGIYPPKEIYPQNEDLSRELFAEVQRIRADKLDERIREVQPNIVA